MICRIRRVVMPISSRRATDGRGTQTRKASHVRVSMVFRLPSRTEEEYRRTIFFTTPLHTIVDSG